MFGYIAELQEPDAGAKMPMGAVPGRAVKGKGLSIESTSSTLVFRMKSLLDDAYLKKGWM